MLMKKDLRYFLVLFFLAFSMQIFAQGKIVTGKVVDENGAPLPGVTVLVEGTQNGTITDVDGKYSLKCNSDEDVMIFTFIGFTTQKVNVSGRPVVDVQMQPDVVSLDEVVAVGYGTMKKSDLSGASVSLNTEKLNSAGLANIDQALKGRAAGVTAVSTSGQPGGSVSIRIRGQSTINAGAEPLYVIDGVPMTNTSSSGHDLGLGDALGNSDVTGISPMSTINPSDIVSMEILKDASSTAIYGSQGANGVIIITTKRGKKGDAKFNYEGSYGIQRQNKRIDVMNLREFAEYSNSVAAETDGRDERVDRGK